MTGDAKSSARARLGQVSGQLEARPKEVHATKYRAVLPRGLEVSWSPLNPLSFLLKAALIRPHKNAIWHPERNDFRLTFSQWADRVANLAYALKSRGVGPGDKILVVAPNTPMFCDAIQAIPAIHGVIVAVNIRLTPGEVAYIAENSGARFALVDYQYADLLQDIPNDLERVISNDTYDDSDPYERFLAEGAQYDTALGDLGWSGLEFQRDENATFAISYTSGTTSRPKGVETTYRGTYLAGIGNAVENNIDESSRYLWILPLFHCIGWCFPYACTMRFAEQICLRGVGDYTDIWTGLLERGVTHYCGAPTVQLGIVNHKLAKKLPRTVVTGVAGAAPTATLIKGLEDLNISVTHLYGLTETYGPVSRNYFNDATDANYYDMKARQGEAFVTSDNIIVARRLKDGEEDNIKEGDLQEVRFDGTEVGEICIRGNITMKGYYSNPKARRQAFAGGYFHTGDLAVRYPDGTYSIQDRSKDIIISGGENISSLSVESALTKLSDVFEVAVVAHKDEKWGERPHAFIIPREYAKWKGKDTAFLEKVRNELRGKISAFALPAYVTLLPELPKTGTGKVQKNVLRDQLKEAK